MDRREPLYYQIYRDLRERIENSEYPEGAQVPTESELEKEYGVSRITSKRALAQLAREGFIERIPGRGSFVLPRRRWARDDDGEASGHDRSVIGFVTQGVGASYGTQLLVGVERAAREAELGLMVRFTEGDPRRRKTPSASSSSWAARASSSFPSTASSTAPPFCRPTCRACPSSSSTASFPAWTFPRYRRITGGPRTSG